MNLFAHFSERFGSDPDRTATVDACGHETSYGELLELTARTAGCLRGRGLSPGDRMAVQLEKSIDAVALYLACLQTGATYLPLNTAYTRRELAYFFNNARPALIVCRPGSLEEVRSIPFEYAAPVVETLTGHGGGSLEQAIRTASPDFGITPRAGDDTAAILYTSGTTGRSKGAMLSHDNLLANAQTLYRVLCWDDDDVLLHVLPIFHVHGLFIAMHCAFLGLSKMIFLPQFGVDQVIDQLPKATVFMGVPTFYTRLLGNPRFTHERCANMRLFMAGSAPLRVDTCREFRIRTGHAILERYGMTEANVITANPYHGERRCGTVGIPLPDVEIRIVDDDGTPVGQGEVGSLEIRGPSVFKGYWEMPEKTAGDFRTDGYFVTGDQAQMDIDGYVAIVGRSKDMIITGGYNVYPKEVEIAIDGLGGVVESAVIGVPHRDYGEAVVAIVVPGNDCLLDEQAITIRLKEQLADYKVPKRIFLTSELPRNIMGKVRKNRLRESYADTFDE